MKFLDQVKIFLKSGDGGSGCVSFRREKYIEFGGPDGGNGGDGGAILLEGCPHLNTLIDFRYKQHFKAPNGESGKGQSRRGQNGEDLVLKVPYGTQVWDETKTFLIDDILDEKSPHLLLKGGSGGRGNESFKSSTNRSPRQSTPGTKGEEIFVWLILKLIADIGLIGLPNAGKSTFLSHISDSRTKVGDYPFTTIHPHLGVVKNIETELTIADLPGLIKDAHQGKGLGDRFLKHAERCKILLHLVDASAEEPLKDFEAIEQELLFAGEVFKSKPRLVVLTKIDLLPPEALKKHMEAFASKVTFPLYAISSHSGEGLECLMQKLFSLAMNS